MDRLQKNRENFLNGEWVTMPGGCRYRLDNNPEYLRCFIKELVVTGPQYDNVIVEFKDGWHGNSGRPFATPEEAWDYLVEYIKRVLV